jgi:hypothetical protein
MTNPVSPFEKMQRVEVYSFNDWVNGVVFY